MPSRSTLGLAALAFIGWGCFWLSIKQRAKTEAIYQDRVVERVVEKEILVDKVRTITRVVTKPDGTREVSKETSLTTARSKEVVKEKVVSKPVLHDLPSYSIGASVGRKASLLPEPLYYSLEAGARLGSSPIWLTGQVNTQREVSIGLRLEF